MEHLIDEVDGQGDIRVQAPACPDVRGQRSRGSAKLGYRLLDLLKNLRRVLLHLPGVGRRVLHVDCLVEDGNEGFELIAVDHLKGEKSGKEMEINNRRKRENSPAGDELQQSSVIV